MTFTDWQADMFKYGFVVAALDVEQDNGMLGLYVVRRILDYKNVSSVYYVWKNGKLKTFNSAINAHSYYKDGIRND